jgi:hypothetical protein
MGMMPHYEAGSSERPVTIPETPNVKASLAEIQIHNRLECIEEMRLRKRKRTHHIGIVDGPFAHGQWRKWGYTNSLVIESYSSLAR